MPTKKPPAKKRRSAPRPSLTQLLRENQELNRERDAWLEREAATGDILRMIARAPADIQTVLDGIAERAAKLCAAEDAAIFRVAGDLLLSAAHFGPVPMVYTVGEGRVFDRGIPAGRAVIDRQTIHVPDLTAAVKEFPGAKALGIAMGLRTVLSAPLLRDDTAIGVIHIRRKKKRAFSSTQIKLLETFADQAVIAIENARLFQELTEALEQQTATSEILGVIASSPTDIRPVWKPSRSAPRECAAPKTVCSASSTETLCAWRRIMDRYPMLLSGGRSLGSHRPAAPWWIERSSISRIAESEIASEYPEVAESNRQVRHSNRSRGATDARGNRRSVSSAFAGSRFGRSRRSRSRC